MDRAFASGASGVAPTVPAIPSVGYPTAGNPGSATPATKPGEWWYYMITEEIRKVITDAGLTPAVGNLTQLSAAIQALASAAAMPVGTILFATKSTAPTGFLKANGATINRASYPALFAALVKSSTVTISIASPGVVTWNGHQLSANDPVKFTTTGALPTGLVAGTPYYVVGASITPNDFQLSATAGGAAINTSGAQSGAHTAINAPFGDGDGSTTFTLPDMRSEFPRGWDDGRGGDLNRVFGSDQADDFKSHTHGLSNAGGGVWTSGGNNVAIQFPNGGASVGSATINNTGGTETRPRNVALLACIRF